ncbi:MAG TPA: ABC transporter permease, partial [Desulfobacteria bacterium]|nr:ABC transporter permease [Desulfobacteria bacterium]
MKNWLNTGRGEAYFSGRAGKLMSLLLPALTLMLLLVLWELIVKKTDIEPWILPGPSLIFSSFWESRVLIWQHGVQTVMETAAG